MGTPRKINAILLNIKINRPKLVSMCRYNLTTYWQNFTEIYLTRVKILRKVLGRLLFFDSHCSVCLLIYLSATSRKNCWLDLHLNFTGDVLVCMDKNWLYCGSHLRMDHDYSLWALCLITYRPAGNCYVYFVIWVFVIIARMCVKWWRRCWKAFRQKLTAYQNAARMLRHCFWWSISDLLSCQVCLAGFELW